VRGLAMFFWILGGLVWMRWREEVGGRVGEEGLLGMFGLCVVGSES
jgi:hypothetical protein